MIEVPVKSTCVTDLLSRASWIIPWLMLVTVPGTVRVPPLTGQFLGSLGSTVGVLEELLTDEELDTGGGGMFLHSV